MNLEQRIYVIERSIAGIPTYCFSKPHISLILLLMFVLLLLFGVCCSLRVVVGGGVVAVGVVIVCVVVVVVGVVSVVVIGVGGGGCFFAVCLCVCLFVCVLVCACLCVFVCLFGTSLEQAVIDMMSCVGQDQIINQAEIFPFIVARTIWSEYFTDQHVISFVDNNSARFGMEQEYRRSLTGAISTSQNQLTLRSEQM